LPGGIVAIRNPTGEQGQNEAENVQTS
jgi:hypothetical protein